MPSPPDTERSDSDGPVSLTQTLHVANRVAQNIDSPLGRNQCVDDTQNANVRISDAELLLASRLKQLDEAKAKYGEHLSDPEAQKHIAGLTKAAEDAKLLASNQLEWLPL